MLLVFVGAVAISPSRWMNRACQGVA
jgi:hypothetical protein